MRSTSIQSLVVLTAAVTFTCIGDVRSAPLQSPSSPQNEPIPIDQSLGSLRSPFDHLGSESPLLESRAPSTPFGGQELEIPPKTRRERDSGAELFASPNNGDSPDVRWSPAQRRVKRATINPSGIHRFLATEEANNNPGTIDPSGIPTFSHQADPPTTQNLGSAPGLPEFSDKKATDPPTTQNLGSAPGLPEFSDKKATDSPPAQRPGATDPPGTLELPNQGPANRETAQTPKPELPGKPEGAGDSPAARGPDRGVPVGISNSPQTQNDPTHPPPATREPDGGVPVDGSKLGQNPAQGVGDSPAAARGGKKGTVGKSSPKREKRPRNPPAARRPGGKVTANRPRTQQTYPAQGAAPTEPKKPTPNEDAAFGPIMKQMRVDLVNAQKGTSTVKVKSQNLQEKYVRRLNALTLEYTENAKVDVKELKTRFINTASALHSELLERQRLMGKIKTETHFNRLSKIVDKVHVPNLRILAGL
jgi:hypothetical protein